MSEAPDLAAQLADVGRRAVSAGLALASGGNVSARLPDGDRFVVSARGAWLDELGSDMLAEVDLDGTAVGDGPLPSSETPLHAAAYRARADCCAVLHLHPPISTLLTAMDQEIRQITTDHALYVPSMRAVPLLASGSRALADAVAAALSESDVVLLTHHGCVVVGSGPRMALARAANLEAAAQATYRALALGDHDTRLPRAEYPSLASYLGPLAEKM